MPWLLLCCLASSHLRLPSPPPKTKKAPAPRPCKPHHTSSPVHPPVHPPACHPHNPPAKHSTFSTLSHQVQAKKSCWHLGSPIVRPSIAASAASPRLASQGLEPRPSSVPSHTHRQTPPEIPGLASSDSCLWHPTQTSTPEIKTPASLYGHCSIQRHPPSTSPGRPTRRQPPGPLHQTPPPSPPPRPPPSRPASPSQPPLFLFHHPCSATRTKSSRPSFLVDHRSVLSCCPSGLATRPLRQLSVFFAPHQPLPRTPHTTHHTPPDCCCLYRRCILDSPPPSASSFLTPTSSLLYLFTFLTPCHDNPAAPAPRRAQAPA